LWAGVACGQQPATTPPTYNKGDTIILQEPGKPETKVKVLSVRRNTDGKIAYEVQDVQTGDRATISDSPMMPSPVAEAPAPKKGLLRFLKPPTGGRKSTGQITQKNQKSGTRKGIFDFKTPAMTKEPVPSQVQPASGTEIEGQHPSHGPSAKAPPSDWQKSWGKADEHSCCAGGKCDASRNCATARVTAPVQTASFMQTGSTRVAAAGNAGGSPMIRTAFASPTMPQPVFSQTPPEQIYPQAGTPFWYAPRMRGMGR
jgi:hypothetical protein